MGGSLLQVRNVDIAQALRICEDQVEVGGSVVSYLSEMTRNAVVFFRVVECRLPFLCWKFPGFFYC